MKYKIVYSYFITDLESLVNNEIEQGWKPLGSLCYKYDGGLFLQALVKEEE